MSAYRKFDVSAFLAGTGNEKFDTGDSAIPAIPAIGGILPNKISAPPLAGGCYSVAIPAAESAGYRKFDPQSVDLEPTAAEPPTVGQPETNLLPLHNDDAEERASIVQLDGRPTPPETPQSSVRETPTLPRSKWLMTAMESDYATPSASPDIWTPKNWADAFGVPIEWVEGYRAMLDGEPRSIPKPRWSGLTVAVAVIFERWALQAIALGWDDLEHFKIDSIHTRNY